MPPQKQNSGFVLPQIIDPPRKCIKIWIPNEVYHRGAFWGAIFELTQFFNWQQNRPDDARAVANLWFDIWSEATRENDMNGCCADTALQYRVNPTTGLIEQSANGGTTWQPAANTLQQYIVEPVPPVTAGTSATKCDAATNVSGQVDVWITQVTNDFDTAVSLLEFALAVLEAILVAVVTILSAGTLTAAELLVLPTISAACAAAWGAGKTVFVDYWTTENKDKVLCAAFCNIGADGHFTDAQFSAFWNQCNADLPASPAKMLFMGFLSSVGRQGLNAMAATGLSADADCNDCTECLTCEIDSWENALWYGGEYLTSPSTGTFGTEIARDATSITIQSSDRGDGQQAISLSTASGLLCCAFTAEFIGSAPSSTLHFFNYCGNHAAYETMVQDNTAPFTQAFTQCYLQMDAGSWTVKFTIVP